MKIFDSMSILITIKADKVWDFIDIYRQYQKLESDTSEEVSRIFKGKGAKVLISFNWDEKLYKGSGKFTKGIKIAVACTTIASNAINITDRIKQTISERMSQHNENDRLILEFNNTKDFWKNNIGDTNEKN